MLKYFELLNHFYYIRTLDKLNLKLHQDLEWGFMSWPGLRVSEGEWLACEYFREFSKKFETVLMGYSVAGGKLIH